MISILIALGDAYDDLSSDVIKALANEGYEVSHHPTNEDFGLQSDNPHLWRTHPVVLRAAEATNNHAFVSDCRGPTSKIITIPDDVNWRITLDHRDREFVEEIHRTWR